MPDVLGAGLLLSDAERDRFATWLESEAKSAVTMIEQMKKISVPQVAINREHNYAVACGLIAHHLRRTESASIG